MKKIVYGVIAGASATLVMTGVMRRLHRHLHSHNKYPLPPSLITAKLANIANPSIHKTLSAAAHFGYGGVTGAMFPLVKKHINGPCYGLLIWTLSYLGWIPAFRILSPAYKQPLERNLLMLVSHIVWGTGLAVFFQELKKADPVVFTSFTSQSHKEGVGAVEE